MKTKILLHLVTTPAWGGSHQYAQAIVRALAKLNPDNYEIKALYPDDYWEVFLNKNLKINFSYHAVAPSLKLTLKFWWYKFFQPKKLKGLFIRQNNKNLQTWNADIFISPQMCGLPYSNNSKHIGVIHDLMHLYEGDFPEAGSKEEVESREFYFKKLTKTAHTILVDSEVGKGHVHERYSDIKGNIEVLPYTVFESQVPDYAVKPNHPLPEKFLFYPAQFWKHKNHARLVEAVAICKEKYPEICQDMCFVLTGGMDKNGYEEFLQKTKDTGLEKAFHALGYVSTEEISWLYKNARALVMPTFFGPTNIPPLEAFSLACPVAVSDIYGHRERYGDAALYFDQKDSHCIADALFKLWTSDVLVVTLKEKGLEQSKIWTEQDFQKRFLEIIYDIRCNI